MSAALLNIQKRLVELGRIRLGEKGAKGEPKKLSTFRMTSASKTLLEKAAKLYGGSVVEWHDAPNPGFYQVTTDSAELPVLIPPIPTLVSQYYEAWSGGGCKRRCDGETELLSGGPCKCTDETRGTKDGCKVTTRISVMLPQLPGLGLWRLESHGWNAATTLPGTVELLAGQGRFIQAVLRLEQRSEKKDGKTKRYVVPVIDIPDMTLGALIEEGSPALMLGGTAPLPPNVKVERPALPTPAELPAENPAWDSGDTTTEFRSLYDALGQQGSKTVDGWLKENKKRVLALPVDEQDDIRVRVEEIRLLPF